MASPTALVAWKKVAFLGFLLIAVSVSARELAGANVVTRTAREMATMPNGVIGGSRLIARQLDTAWRGHYSPPPPRSPPPPPHSS
ncbi:hypothetical protein SDJN03_24378, partial [Cucurbita argyrosperma subsp. sororia]